MEMCRKSWGHWREPEAFPGVGEHVEDPVMIGRLELFQGWA